jgi:hypothetical protein
MAQQREKRTSRAATILILTTLVVGGFIYLVLAELTSAWLIGLIAGAGVTALR